MDASVCCRQQNKARRRILGATVVRTAQAPCVDNQINDQSENMW